MPPAGAPQPPAAERTALLNWLESALAGFRGRRDDLGGPTVLRRLNRVEYQNTMRDLLGLDLTYTRNFPPDEVSRDGFTNNGSARRLSALQLEQYLGAARSGLSRAIVEGPPPPVHEHRAQETVIDKLKTLHWSNRLGRTGTFVARIPEFPDEGDFILRVRVRAEIPDGSPYPRMHVALGYRADTQTPRRTVAEVDVTGPESKVFEFRGRIEEYPIQSRTQSKYPGLLVWVRNSYSDGHPPPIGRKVTVEGPAGPTEQMVWDVDPGFPAIVVEALDFRAPDYPSWPPPHHTALLPVIPRSASEEGRAAEVALRQFIPRAFRRPVQQSDLESALGFFGRIRPSAATFEQAMRETLAMVLVSPDFLYLVEDTAGPRGRLDAHELASRLSYFLWASTPDARLMDAADRGELRKPRVLRAEAERMLDDPRSLDFVRQFTGEWLDLQGLDRVAVNPNYYPAFDPTLKKDMRRETEEYFAVLLRGNMSALHLLQSDFAVINERMATHYGFRGPRGASFEPFSLAGSGRVGGLLTHAGILLANSTGEDSHPVERGVWIRRALLGDPPPPPPAAVPNLASAGAAEGLLSTRRQLELHRDSPACTHCHAGIDPWGVALEAFDAVGLQRSTILRRSGEREERHPVDARAVLPDGQAVDGAEELASYLRGQRSDQFARTLASKMLAYAMGRSVGPADRQAVDGIVRRFQRADHGLRDLCTIIVTSEMFRRR